MEELERALKGDPDFDIKRAAHMLGERARCEPVVARGRWQIHRLIEHDTLRNYRVTLDGEEVATARIETPRGGFCNVTNVTVKEEHQRLGVATALYDVIEEDVGATGAQLVPSPDISLSDDARAFWTSRRGGSVA